MAEQDDLVDVILLEEAKKQVVLASRRLGLLHDLIPATKLSECKQGDGVKKLNHRKFFNQFKAHIRCNPASCLNGHFAAAFSAKMIASHP